MKTKSNMKDKKKKIRELSLEWFFQKTEDEKLDLKNKYFPKTYIIFDSQWGLHFTFGQIEEMYLKEK